MAQHYASEFIQLGVICTQLSLLSYSVTATSTTEVSEAISKAQDAFASGIWSKSSVLHRSTTLSKLARILEERIPDLATIESQQTGRPIREMKVQLSRLPEWL